jgi:hypothetical protein
MCTLLVMGTSKEALQRIHLKGRHGILRKYFDKYGWPK